ncbi:hypothetical protein V2G26_019735 [Clonostachys chloroleuca]
MLTQCLTVPWPSTYDTTCFPPPSLGRRQTCQLTRAVPAKRQHSIDPPSTRRPAIHIRLRKEIIPTGQFRTKTL